MHDDDWVGLAFFLETKLLYSIMGACLLDGYTRRIGSIGLFELGILQPCVCDTFLRSNINYKQYINRKTYQNSFYIRQWGWD